MLNGCVDIDEVAELVRAAVAASRAGWVLHRVDYGDRRYGQADALVFACCHLTFKCRSVADVWSLSREEEG